MVKNPIMPEEEKNKQSIFIDADALVALTDQNDASHTQAKEIQAYLATFPHRRYSSSFAVGEAITVISQNGGLSLAIPFAQTIFSGDIHVIDASRRHCLNAVKKFTKQTSKNARFTDMINMILMENLDIDTIFSFDKHYEQAGFHLLTV